MQTYRIILEPLGPWITEFQADTLFGHIAWAVQRKDGDSAVEKFVAPFLPGSEQPPPFLISDAFPEGCLPFPEINPELVQQAVPETAREVRTDLSDAIQTLVRDSNFMDEVKDPAERERLALSAVVGYRKKFFKEPHLDEESFFNLIAGAPDQALKNAFSGFISNEEAKRLDEEIGLHKPSFKRQPMIRNSIDRRTFTTPAEGGLYSLREYWARRDREKTARLQLFVRCDEGLLDRIVELLKFVGEFGYGKKSTIGRGWFKVYGDPKPEERLSYDGGDFVTLAPFVPSDAQVDLANSRYRLRLKRGRLGPEFASRPGLPFAKRPFQMIAPGSTIHPVNGYSGPFGRALTSADDLVPGGEKELEKVIHYAYAFPVGVKNLL